MEEPIIEQTKSNLNELGWYHYVFLGVDLKGKGVAIFEIMTLDDFWEFLFERAVESGDFLYDLGKLAHQFQGIVNAVIEKKKKKI